MMKIFGLGQEKKLTKIFGIGMPKTGSTTLGECFSILGYKYRPWNGPENVSLIQDIRSGDLTKVWKMTKKFDCFKG